MLWFGLRQPNGFITKWQNSHATPFPVPGNAGNSSPWYTHRPGKLFLVYFNPGNDRENEDNQASDADIQNLRVNQWQAAIVPMDYPIHSVTADNIPILRFSYFDKLFSPKDCQTIPPMNQTATQSGEFCKLWQQHGEWFLYDNNGKAVRNTSGWYHMDPSNYKWQEFFVTRLIQTQNVQDWQGFFLDSIDTSIPDGLNLTDSYLHDTRISFRNTSAYIHEYIPGQTIIGRIRGLNFHHPASLENYYALFPYLDGVYLDDFFSDSQDSWLWEMQFDLVKKTQQLGRNIILSYKEPTSTLNVDHITWFLVSVLLSDQGLSSITCLRGNPTENTFYDFFNTGLGSAISDSVRDGKVWKRQFENGHVTLDLARHQAEIILDP